MHYDCFMGALLELRGLQIRFGAMDAVRGISLQLDEGEVLGLVGESGSGKSVTALAIMELLGPTATTRISFPAVSGSAFLSPWRSSTARVC